MSKEIEINPAKIGGWIAGIVAVVVLVLNLFTVTQPGMTKVQTCFGKVQEGKTFAEGIHVPVAPWCGFDVFDTRESRYEIDALTIPTQDRFNSTANVTVLYRIQPSYVTQIRQEFGDQQRYIDVTLRQHLRAIARNEGRKITDSRGLANSDNITTIQQNALEYLRANLVGIEINEVLIQDIEFDSRIATQILQTQQRIEREEAEKSLERIAATQAQQEIEKARGASESKKLATDAITYATRETADADRYALEQQAEGNKALTASLTAQILRRQELDNEAILFSKSQGNVPHTVIGETDLRAYGIPLQGTAVK